VHDVCEEVSYPTFSQRAKAWSAPPVDDIGYLPSKDLLTWDDEALLDLISQMAQSRYQGWRNYQMKWRIVLGLDNTRGRRVLDYGCGVGLEALQYAKLGNTVSIADISADNLKLAERVVQLGAPGHVVDGVFKVQEKSPFIEAEPESFDVVHCCGVLHHIPHPEPVVQRFSELLSRGGELRLMVYSDEAWKIATGTEPPTELNVEDYVQFDAFWQHWDPIGGYADWYDCDRLMDRFGEWFTMKECNYLTEHNEYLGAVLVKR